MLKTNKLNWLIRIEAEYIDYRDILRVSIKLFSLISLHLILKNSYTLKSYESDFIFGIKHLFFVTSKYSKKLERLYIKFNLLFFINITFVLVKEFEESKNFNEVFLDEIFKLAFIQNEETFSLELDKPIDIIIPVYNGFQYLEDLFNSIFLGTHIDYRLIIIEDKSVDERVLPFLKQLNNDNHINCKDIILIENEENLGFVKSVNKGASYANNHFVLLNTDVIVPEGWLEKLIYPIINYSDIASVTPFTNSGTICSFPNFCEDNKIYLDLDINEINKAFKSMPLHLSYDEIPTAVGFCMAINEGCWKEIGDFDTIYEKGYGEENDWCMRSSHKNYKHLIAKNLYVYHKHGGSFSNEEKQNQLSNNYKILISKYPEYDKLVSNFIMQDRLKSTRYFLSLQLILSNAKKICIILSHKRGGGTEVYLEKYIKEKIDDCYLAIIVYKKLNNNHYLLNIQYENINYTFLMNNLYELYILFDSVNIKFISEIIVNSIVDFNVNEMINFILNFRNKFNSKLIYLMHDYFCICPNINLLYKNIYYCEVPKDINICYECLDKVFDIKLYRHYFQKLLQFSDDIVVFSKSSEDISLKAFNINRSKIKIIPHKVDWIKTKAKESNYKKDKLNIGVLGDIGYHKGSNILKSLLELSLNKNPNFHFYLIGETNSDMRYKNLSILGRYNRNNLIEIVSELNIDIFVMPAIWPETFSYVTEEIILMNKPVICFNLGAQGERVYEYDKGYIVKDISAKAMYESIIEFYNNRMKK